MTPQANVLSWVPIFLNWEAVKPCEKHCASQYFPGWVATKPGPNPAELAAVHISKHQYLPASQKHQQTKYSGFGTAQTAAEG